MWLVTDLDTLETFIFNTLDAVMACCEHMNFSVELYYPMMQVH